MPSVAIVYDIVIVWSCHYHYQLSIPKPITITNNNTKQSKKQYQYQYQYHIQPLCCVDDGQTNSVLFHLLISLAVKRRIISSQRIVDWSTTDRRVLIFFTYQSGRGKSYHNEPADCQWVDDEQTNSVLFELSVWPSSIVQY